MLKGLQRSRPSKDIRAPVMTDLLRAFPVALRIVATSDYETLLFSHSLCRDVFRFSQGMLSS